MKHLFITIIVIVIGAVISGATYINGVETFAELNVSNIVGPLSLNSEASSHSLTGAGDLIVSKFEANDVGYFDNDLTVSDVLTVSGSHPIYLRANISDIVSTYGQSITFSTDGDLILKAGAGTNNINIGAAAADVDYSVTFDGETNDGILTYMEDEDQLVFDGAFKADDFYSGDGTQGATDSTSFWMCTASDCSTTCQVTIKDGLITSCS